jgi:hypothetical protein
MELHHSKHHNTYVTSFNAASEKMEEARSKNDIQTQIATQPLINFHGGKTPHLTPIAVRNPLTTIIQAVTSTTLFSGRTSLPSRRAAASPHQALSPRPSTPTTVASTR